MTPWTFVSRDPEETFAAGRELGRAIGSDGVVIALIGPLGAGKTVFVKGLAEGLGLDPRRVSSPTFVIAQQYPLSEGPEVLHHVDLYRLEVEQELEDLGFDDLLAPGAVLAVEWADRFPQILGRDRLAIEFEGPSASEAEGTDAATDRPSGPGRRAAVSASGRTATQVAADWMERLERRTEGRGADGGFERLSALVVLLMAGFAALASAASSESYAAFCSSCSARSLSMCWRSSISSAACWSQTGGTEQSSTKTCLGPRLVLVSKHPSAFNAAL